MRFRGVAAVFLLVGASAYVSTLACELVLPTVASDAPAASAPGAADARGPDTVAPCDGAWAPTRPDAGESGTVDFTTAVEIFGAPDGGALVGSGYDLDRVCTGQGGAGESCAPPVRGDLHADTQGGRDVGGNRVLSEAFEGAFSATKLGDINSRIASGLLSFVIKVRRYNGGPDQRELSVELFDSSGVHLRTDAGLKVSPPGWDGGDLFSIDCMNSSASCGVDDRQWIGDASFTSAFLDSNAYVANHQLVARFSSVFLNLGLTSLTISRAALVASIIPVEGGYRLEGQLVGVVRTRDAMLAAARLHSTPTTFLCGDDPAFQQVLRPTICGAADIAQSSVDITGAAPPGDPKATCDALAIAAPFVALPAQVGYRFDLVPLPAGCDGSVDDCKPE